MSKREPHATAIAGLQGGNQPEMPIVAQALFSRPDFGYSLHMSNNDPKSPSAAAEPAAAKFSDADKARKLRLAKTLKVNLKRRKQQFRLRKKAADSDPSQQIDDTVSDS